MIEKSLLPMRRNDSFSPQNFRARMLKRLHLKLRALSSDHPLQRMRVGIWHHDVVAYPRAIVGPYTANSTKAA